MTEPRTYQLGVVGEANYQPAIRRCSPGDSVELVHEPDNPYDDLALAVVTLDGQTIGYVARDCWLQDAVHEEGKGCDATIKDIRSSEGGKLGVVLDVCLNAKGVGERAFSRAASPRTSRGANRPAKGFWSRLFGL